MSKSSDIFKEEKQKTKNHHTHFLARTRVICYLKLRYKTYNKHRLKIQKILDRIDKE